MSVSFDLELGEAIKVSATGSGQSVSGWLAEAARDRLRLESLGQAMAAWEHEFGPLTATEVAEASHLLARAAEKRRGGAA